MTQTMKQPLPNIEKNVVMNAPIEKVWKAVSTAEGISVWLMPNDFRAEVGAEFSFDAGPYGMSPCKVTELDPPHLVGFDWGKDWHLSIELKDLGGKTEVTLIHAGWDAEQVTESGEPHTIVRERMDQGWGQLNRLRSYVEG